MLFSAILSLDEFYNELQKHSLFDNCFGILFLTSRLTSSYDILVRNILFSNQRAPTTSLILRHVTWQMAMCFVVSKTGERSLSWKYTRTTTPALLYREVTAVAEVHRLTDLLRLRIVTVLSSPFRCVRPCNKTQENQEVSD